MNPKRLESFFLDLLRIPSPSGREGRLAAYIKKMAEEYGWEVTEDGAGKSLGGDSGNLILRPSPGKIVDGGTGPGIFPEPFFLAAHMDTVDVPFEEEIPVIVEDGLVHTRGACVLGADDKAGIASALELMALAGEAPQRLARPFEVLLTVREEQGGLGAKYFDPGFLRSRQGFNLDGETPVATAVRQAPFKLRYTIEVRGKSAHAALAPQEGVNAVQAAGSILDRLPGGLLDEVTTANVGSVEGGGSTNVVPDRCRIVGELRSLDQDAMAKWKTRIEQAASSAAAERKAAAAFFWENLYPGYFIGDREICVELFAESCRRMEKSPALLASRGGGDANHLNGKGLRCIVVGLGMENIHSPEERYYLSRLREGAELLETLLFRSNRI